MSKAESTVSTALLKSPGDVVLIESKGYPNTFATRLRSDSPPPGSVEADTPSEYIVAYSRLCTHMGGHVVTQADEKNGTIRSVDEEGVIRCPCHLTCFDLRHSGLVVVGQATSNLAQLKIEWKSKNELIIQGWLAPAYRNIHG